MNSSQEILQIFVDCIQKTGKTEKETLLDSKINTSFLTDWKNGRMKSPSYDKIIRLANYLNIDLNYLFTGKERTDAKAEKSAEALTKQESRCLETFRKLTEYDRGRITERMETMLESYPPEVKEVI